MEVVLKTEDDTIEFAKKFAKKLKKGDILLLDGDLGAGKTVFTKGLVLGLSQGKEMAISPTFTIVNEYNTTPRLYHFDFYRIEKPEEALDTGLYDYLDSGSLCLLEWPENIEDLLPDETLRVKISVQPDGSRVLTWTD